jgi:hypothetical protein
MPDGGETKALGTASLRRRQLPGDTLIEFEFEFEFEFGLGLAEEVPVRYRPGIIVPGRRSAGRRDISRTSSGSISPLRANHRSTRTRTCSAMAAVARRDWVVLGSTKKRTDEPD